MNGVPGFAAVFTAGVLTILSPCCLPLIPAVVSSGTGHRYRPVVLVFGSVLSFTVLGLAVGAIASISPETFRLPLVGLLIVFGAVLVDDDLNRIYERRASRLAAKADRRSVSEDSGSSLLGGFVTGTLLGVIWLPCVGPILGGVLAFAGSSGNTLVSGSLLFTYGVGFAVPLLVTAYVGKDAIDRTGFAKSQRNVRRLVGSVLLVTGVALLFDIDKLLMRFVIDLSLPIGV
ncbi:Cytochrome C biogenesis protein transmembrane region [Halogranum amylolyticum]|uniref:Cytochrome C biogenesis protein transmembrane region n=1 Tax=Halogranum amylolyticum TaxID=660520 RepID=A0A1H8NJT6_9EURY|nr:cytochrome c biogenesis protein CcdA [Halogranum amylolyticum]SEO29865.1 Cytochrome C biogenesis protein transmembrane region [Halogranum amylolyticum]